LRIKEQETLLNLHEYEYDDDDDDDDRFNVFSFVRQRNKHVELTRFHFGQNDTPKPQLALTKHENKWFIDGRPV